MTTKQRTYRGVAYKTTSHEQLNANNVEHVYRGHRYEAPLKHEAAASDKKVELSYRGSVYQQRQNAASEQAKA